MSTADINLTQLQKTLDTQGIELVENQKESLVGRKALADRTKGSCGRSLPIACSPSLSSHQSSKESPTKKNSVPLRHYLKVRALRVPFLIIQYAHNQPGYQR
jgi:homeobox protein cut-like